MALKSTIFKIQLSVADLDRQHYGDYSLTLARHPSETDERMMVRLLAFALFAEERLEFGKGLSTTEEPALWWRDYDGSIRLWVEVGQPEEKVLRKAAGRADRVALITYGSRSRDVWWNKEGDAICSVPKLRVLSLNETESSALAALAERTMQLQCTIQDGHLWLAGEGETIEITPRVLCDGWA